MSRTNPFEDVSWYIGGGKGGVGQEGGLQGEYEFKGGIIAGVG